MVACGVRAAEAFLLAELRRLHDAACADLARLARPVRVVVPSRSLRDHLAARLVSELGGVAGIQIQTLHTLASEVLERARSGEITRGGEALVPVLVQRFATAEPALSEALGPFEGGYGVALASVNDLLDAGLDATNVDSSLECIAAAGPRVGAQAAGRAEALVRVAERVAGELDKRGLEPRAGVFRRAREALEGDPERLPTRAAFVYGWADATGVQLDLLEALVRGSGACIVLDHPPDPADPADAGPGPRWTERLRLRLGDAAGGLASGPGEARLDAVEAPGTHAEARAVAGRIRALLDRGAAPESIGIVLRDPTPYRHALHAQLGRLGIPFSGGVGPVGPAGRRLAALLELLERGESCPADRWLDAQARLARDRVADLRLALHGIGVGRLADVAKLELGALLGDRDSYPLPVRRGIRASPSDAAAGAGEGAEPPAEGEPHEGRAPRRHVSRRMLERARVEAASLIERIAALRAAPQLDAQLALLRGLLAHELGWRPERVPAATEVYGRLTRLEDELGGATELAADELGGVLARALGELAAEPLGGSGGGVALLSAVEARGRSFAHLFVMGLNRDAFPRLVREDPLLPDALRRALETVLPDVPVKGRGEDEERYLFAALCAAAPAVTLSWLATTDDGKERPPSPFVEALRGRIAIEAAPPVLASPSGPRPALEHAIGAGLARDRARSEAALGIALRSETLGRARAEAAARLDVGGWPDALGPFFGFVGAIGAGDPRARELPVTRLESMAYCAWRTFLERVLSLEPPPDSLAELPDATPLLVGNVVHAVLEALVGRAGGPLRIPVEDARTREPVRVAWPGPDDLAALAHEAAASAARGEGIVLPGFARLLARRVLPLLERVRELEWTGAGPAVLAAEVMGELAIVRADGSTRALRFRADRADRVEGAVALTDYKTGQPISSARTSATRTEHLRAQIERGRRLQGPAYAQAGPGVREGRYLFAKDGVEDENARVVIASDDGALRGAFEAAARDLLAAFEAGAFPPRLLGPKRTGVARACESCDVAEACLQGETGSRRHLAAWLAHHDAAPERLPGAVRAAHALLVRTEER